MTVHTIREERDRAVQALAKEYPKAFFVVAERRKPLKHDIVKDIEADLAKDNDSPLLDYDIVDAIAWYTGHVGYWKACSVAGINRIDLQGRPAGKITPAKLARPKQRQRGYLPRWPHAKKKNCRSL